MRLFDLHVDWLLQYAGETTVFDPACYPGVAGRVAQASGYLQATTAAVVACFRGADEWAKLVEPWPALDTLIARVEAEFSGRILRDPADLDFWRTEPDSLTWAVLGVEGFDSLVRTEADLNRLPDLVRRGVRMFQPTYAATGLLAGSSQPGDDRGLLDLGRRFLDRLAGVADPEAGTRPIVDLAHLNQGATADVLAWFESDGDHSRRLGLAYSHGALCHDGFSTPRALSLANAARLRSLGGTIGFGVSPPFYRDPAQIRAGIEAAAGLPFLGRAGYEGIAIGTDFLGVDATLPGLGIAEDVCSWFVANFPSDVAALILHENPVKMIERSIALDNAGRSS